jgi:HPt (histidine-containing phosphotransfer) domain-containing protein
MRSEGVTVPIFALTANAMKGAEKDVMDAGCSGFLTKPINIDQLMETLAALLGGTRITAPVAVEAEAVPTRSEGTSFGGPFAAQESATNAVSQASPELLAAEPASGPPVRSRLADKPRLRPAVRKFAGRLDEQMAVIEKAFSGRAFDELAALAHWLKGAAGTVGYDDFTEPAMHLEEGAHAKDIPALELTMAQIRDLVSRLEVPADDAVAAAVS